MLRSVAVMAACALRMPYSITDRDSAGGSLATDMASLPKACPKPAGSSSAIAESIPNSDRSDEATSAASWRSSPKGSAVGGFDGFDGFDESDGFTDDHLHLSATSVPANTIGDHCGWQNASPCEQWRAGYSRQRFSWTTSWSVSWTPPDCWYCSR